MAEKPKPDGYLYGVPLYITKMDATPHPDHAGLDLGSGKDFTGIYVQQPPVTQRASSTDPFVIPKDTPPERCYQLIIEELARRALANQPLGFDALVSTVKVIRTMASHGFGPRVGAEVVVGVGLLFGVPMIARATELGAEFAASMESQLERKVNGVSSKKRVLWVHEDGTGEIMSWAG